MLTIVLGCCGLLSLPVCFCCGWFVLLFAFALGCIGCVCWCVQFKLDVGVVVRFDFWYLVGGFLVC